MPLTALKVKKTGPGKHAHVHGLYLVVRPNGGRSWMLRYQHKGRRRDFGLGPVHDVSLAEARVAVKVHESAFRLLEGEKALVEYRFHTGTARHFSAGSAESTHFTASAWRPTTSG